VSEVEHHSATQESSAPSAGERLRAAREELDLSSIDVAKRLRLKHYIVEALEQDNYDVLGGAAFVTGYLRSYAKLVGIDGELLVRDYRPAVIEQELLPNIDYRRQRSLGNWPMRLGTLVVVGGLAGLLAYWWVQQGADGVNVFVAAQADGPATVARVEEPLQTLPDPRDVQVAPDLPADIAPAPSTPLAEPETDPAPLPVSRRLLLRYSDDSWTEVRDATDKQLVYGLIKAGREIEVEGEAPFEVFLGYGPGVSLAFDGVSFEHQSYTRRDSYVARFVVDDAQSGEIAVTQQP